MTDDPLVRTPAAAAAGAAPAAAPRFDPGTTINDLVARHPALMPVLAGHGLDLCCGGPLTLRQAAERHGLDLDALLADLAGALAAA